MSLFFRSLFSVYIEDKGLVLRPTYRAATVVISVTYIKPIETEMVGKEDFVNWLFSPGSQIKTSRSDSKTYFR